MTTIDWNMLRPPVGSPHLLVYNETTQRDEYRLVDLVVSGDSIKTVLDLGGNVGFFAIRAAQTFPGSHVISYEADPDNAKEFRRNLGRVQYAVSERITLVPAAVSGEAGTVTLASGLAGCSWVNRDERVPPDEAEIIDVPAVSINDVLSEHETVDLLKIDVEGAEYDVIANADDELLERVGHVAMEIHWWDDQGPEVQPALIDKLSQHFRLSGATSGNGMLYGARW